MRRFPLGSIIAIALAIAVAESAEADAPGFARYRIRPGRLEWASDPRTSHLKPGVISRMERGYFEIDTTVAGVPKATCFFCVPLTRSNAAAPSANDIILRFGYMGQKCLGGTDPVIALAEKHGFSLLSITWPNQEGIDRNYDRRHSIYPESGSGEAWSKAIAGLRTIWQFKPGLVHAVGWSAGGTAAFQFANGLATAIDGVVAIGGRHFPAAPSYSGPTLLMHSEKDRSVQNLQLENALLDLGCPVTRITFPPIWTDRGKNDNWAHNIDGRSWEVGIEWILALSEMLRANHGNPRPLAAWPLVGGFRFPGKSERTTKLLASLSRQNLLKSERTTKLLASLSRQNLLKPLDDGGAIARASVGDNAEGVIWVIDYRSTSDDEDAMAHAQLLASALGDCISITLGLETASDPRETIGRILDRPAPPSCVVLIEPRGDPAGFRWLTALPKAKTIVVFRHRPDFIPVLQQLAASGKANLCIVSAQSGSVRDGRIRSLPWANVLLPGEQYEQEQAKIVEILGGSVVKR